MGGWGVVAWVWRRLASGSERARVALVAFGVVSGGIGLFALVQVHRAGEVAERLYAGLSRDLDLVAALHYDAQETRRSMLYALSTTDPNLQVRYADESRDASQRVDEAVATHRMRVETPADRDVVNRFAGHWADYLAVRDEVIASILEGDVRAGVARDLAEGASAFERVRADLLGIQRLAKAKAERRRREIQSASNRSLQTLIAILLLAQVLAVLALRFVQRAELFRHDRKAALDLGRTLSLLAATLESTADGIMVVDRQGRVTTHNRRFLELWQLPPELLAERDGERVLAAVAAQLRDPDGFLRKFHELTVLPDEDSFDELETRDGRMFERYSLPQRIEGRPVGRVWSFRDVTDRKAAERRLVHDAFHDALTFLPNRARFTDLLGRAIARVGQSSGYSFAVLFLDIDRFKIVNDSLGHLVGDQLLVAMARRLEECVRPGDVVARLGGDEFTVLLDGIESHADATHVADRIQSELRQPFHLAGQEVVTSASIGIALSTSGYSRPDDMLRDADIAMYRAKALGKARYEIFDAAMHQRAAGLLQLETDLRRALQRGELDVAYQPVVALASGAIVGFEALVRWDDPQRGPVPPAEFVPMAEETGLVVPLGRHVLGSACRQVAAWRAAVGGTRSLTVSINLSARQFLHPELVDEVAEALAASGLPPRDLRLELTESVLIENADAAALLLKRLRGLGVRLDLDDFGTGYSSLSYLHRFEMDALKIDRAFIHGLGRRDHDTEIVRAIVALGRNLGLDVVAEGVETAEQRAFLQAFGCAHAQGFLFSEPLPAAEAGALLGIGPAQVQQAGTPVARSAS